MKANEFDRKFGDDEQDILDDFNLYTIKHLNQRQKNVNILISKYRLKRYLDIRIIQILINSIKTINIQTLKFINWLLFFSLGMSLLSCSVNTQQDSNKKYEVITLEPFPLEQLIVAGCFDTNESIPEEKIIAINYYDDHSTDIKSIVLEGKDGSRDNYEFDDNFEKLLSSAETSWKKAIFKYGNYVSLQIYRCGNAGYPYIKKISFKRLL